MSLIGKLWGLAVASIVTLALGGASPAQAAPIIWIDDIGGVLGKVNIATSTVTVVGNTDHILTDIAFSPAQSLFGITFSALYSINQATAAATLVGPLGVSDVNGLVFGADGTLYGSGLSGGFYSINPATGAATLIGNTGFGSAGDLAFIGNTLFEAVVTSGTSSLITVDPATGVGTLVGTIINSPDLFALIQGSDGNLYGVASTDIYLIDTITGAGTLVGNYGGQGLAEAYGAASRGAGPTPPPPVPEPSSLALLGSALAGFGMLWRRKA
jgi:PEP-CTERM motif